MSAPDAPAVAEDWRRQPEGSCADPGPGATTAAGRGAAVATLDGVTAAVTLDGVTAAAVVTPASATMIKGDLTIDNRTSRVRTLTVIVRTFDWEPPLQMTGRGHPSGLPRISAKASFLLVKGGVTCGRPGGSPLAIDRGDVAPGRATT